MVEVKQQATVRRKQARIALLLLLLVIAAGTWLATPPKEPEYQGKPLSEWLERCETVLMQGELATRDRKIGECREAVQRIGTNAIPPLLQILRTKDSTFKTQLARLAGQQSWVPVPFASVETEKPKAELGFLLLGPLATNAVSDLLAIQAHPPSDYSGEIAASTLKRLYPEPCVATPHWIPEAQRAQWYVSAASLLLQAHDQGSLPSGATNAMQALSQAIQLDPTDRDNYRIRGMAGMSIQDFRAAEADFTKFLATNPRSDDALSLRGICRLQLRDFSHADADFTLAITLQTNSVRAYQWRGVANLYLHKFDEAVADLDHAIALNPNAPDAYYHRAAAKAQQRELEAALVDATHAVQIEPGDPAAHLILGRVKSSLRDYAGALKDFDRAIALGPGVPDAYALRAMCRVYQDQLDLAAPDLAKALRLNPQSAITYFTSAVLKAKQGEDAAALADFERAFELAPEVPEARGALGLFQYKIGQWKPALANCRAALAQGATANMSDLNATFWLIQAQSGDQEAADRHLNQYLQSLAADKTNQWNAITARFFIGRLTEIQFLELATTSARRPGDVPDQVSESFYYAGMKRKIAGDAAGAVEFFHRCLDTHFSNNYAYLYARAELHAAEKR